MKSCVFGVPVWLAMGLLTTSTTSGASAFSASINATDARTGQPLTSIRVVPTSYNSHAKQVTWQSQYLKTYDSLPANYQMKRGWQQTLLRIEAEGYRPFVTKPLARKTDIALEVALEPDEGINGRVLTPRGRPAAGATIAVCTWTNEVTVRNGMLAYGHHAQRLRGLVQTADEGSFRVPAEVDEWVLVVAHESGYAERTATEFAAQSNVTLAPWGRLEGEFRLDGKPMVDHPVYIGAGRGDAQVVLHYATDETHTDPAGGFVADRLPPVKMYVSPLFKHGGSNFNLLWFSGLVEIKSGETTGISLPRPGQAVTGKLTLPPDSGLSFDELEIDLSITLRPPSVSGFGDFVNKSHAAYSALMQSAQGKLFRREKIPVSALGRFFIEGMPETSYVLHATAYRKPATPGADRGKPVASYSSRVQVPAQTDADKLVDLDLLVLKLHPPANR